MLNTTVLKYMGTEIMEPHGHRRIMLNTTVLNFMGTKIMEPHGHRRIMLNTTVLNFMGTKIMYLSLYHPIELNEKRTHTLLQALKSLTDLKLYNFPPCLTILLSRIMKLKMGLMISL